MTLWRKVRKPLRQAAPGRDFAVVMTQTAAYPRVPGVFSKY
jgi:hypothetical protein